MSIERFEQAEALFKPQRVEVLRDAELVTQVGERKVRGIHEGIYQAAARSFWLSPRLVGTIGARPAQDQLSLGYLLSLVEDVQSDLARLEHTPGDLPTLGVSGQIRLPNGDRQAFLDDLQSTLQLFARHGGAEGPAFRLAVACCPTEES